MARMVPTAKKPSSWSGMSDPLVAGVFVFSFLPLCSCLMLFDRIRVGPILTFGIFLSPFLYIDLSSFPSSTCSQPLRRWCYGAPHLFDPSGSASDPSDLLRTIFSHNHCFILNFHKISYFQFIFFKL